MRRRSRPVRFAIWPLAALALGLAACGQDSPAPHDTPPPSETAPETAAPAEDTTWYDDEERAAEDAAAEGEIVWVTGWFAPEALDGPTVADMEPRYRKAAGLAPDADAVQRAQVAFAALEGEGPIDLLNPLEGVALRLLGARVEDHDGAPTAVLDFGEGIAGTNQLGSEGGAAAEAQFHAMVREYFPDATQLVVTVEGAAADLFHGKAYGRPVALAS